MNAITGFSAAYAVDSDGSGAVPIGVLVAEKMRHIRQLRKLRTHPVSPPSRA